MYILQLNVREFLVSSDRFRCLAVSADAVTGSVSRHDTVIHLSGKDRPQAAGVCTPPPLTWHMRAQITSSYNKMQIAYRQQKMTIKWEVIKLALLRTISYSLPYLKTTNKINCILRQSGHQGDFLGIFIRMKVI